MIINDHECDKAGIDPDLVRRLGQRFERLARNAAQVGIEIFGGTGNASLRFDEVSDRWFSRLLSQ